jgi:putative transposase
MKAAHYFESLAEEQETATQWLWTYNNEPPHMGLGGITPKKKWRYMPSLYF